VYLPNTGNFNWQEFDFLTYGSALIESPEPSESRNPHKVCYLHFGRTPESFGNKTIEIDGLSIDATGIKFQTRISSTDVSLNNEKRLNILLDDGNWYYVNLESILSEKLLEILQKWIKTKKSTLVRIANEYEKYDRQIYHFLYDVIALVRSIECLDESNQQIIFENTSDGNSLLHNRAQIEIFNCYKKRGEKISLFAKNDNSKPDLLINDIFTDVKSILITGTFKQQLLIKFAHKLRCDVLEKENKENQIGPDGTFFIVIWSGIINSILYTMFHKMTNDKNNRFHEVLPKIDKKQIIFVIPSTESFKNSYLVFQRDEIEKIISTLATTEYEKIMTYDTFSYLTHTKIVKKFPYGTTGLEPMFTFKMR